MVALSADAVVDSSKPAAPDSESESDTLLLSTMNMNTNKNANANVNVKRTAAAHHGINTVRPVHYDYVKCCFWDTSGSPNYQCLAQSYYTSIAAVIVVFDLSSQSSYNAVNSYISRAIHKNNCSHPHPILVLGNKLDKRAIHFTKKQVFEALCFDFPNENITYEEISCLDAINHCNNCAHSSDIHTVITAFIQSLYDSVIKPHYHNPQAVSDIGCRGISGTSRFFKANSKANVGDASVSKSYNKNAWFWKGNYSEDGRSQTKENGGFVQTQMSNLSKTSRECCNEQGFERVSSCTAGCSIM
jgi:GTPase SAR1 family protein